MDRPAAAQSVACHQEPKAKGDGGGGSLTTLYRYLPDISILYERPLKTRLSLYAPLADATERGNE